ncbi:ATP-binding cassette domain-containing protein [Candidatus Thorarchaeota archaeon]|nr:MAG: ATP-binding cassette domain-containing protein [Candidatus Thorarchaeota archaeon]
MIERANVELMKNNELFRLARVLRIPIEHREIRRSQLIDEIMNAVEELKDSIPTDNELHTPAIKIKNLIKHFGKKFAVFGLNLEVNPGEIVGLVGPNGAGKTTTLRILTGIIRQSSGQVEVNGHDILKDPIKAKSVIGYIPEKPTCYPSLTVKEYVTFMARVYEVPKRIALIRMRQFVDMFHMDEFLNSYVGTLSKGNLQRALLIGIFVRPPPYILALDEPIYGLDPRGAWNLKAHLKHLRDEGSAILVSTHILEVASDLCDRFVIMNDGVVVGKGTLNDLLKKHKKTKNLEEVFLSLTGGIPK